MRTKKAMLLGVILLLVVLLGACAAPVPETVTFPDENMEAAIRDALGKATGEAITPAELAGLTEFAATMQGITDLSGIEYCINLTVLNIWGNPISDLSSLASLTNLTTLNLMGNEISDISPLAFLTNLTWLYLEGNEISDISPLVENSGLGPGDIVILLANNLDLSEGSEDLENIGQLEGRGVVVYALVLPPSPAPTPAPAPTVGIFADENLEAAIREALGKPAGEAITPAEMTGLTSLMLPARCRITDLSGIEYCTNLIWLSLGANPISDVSPLASLTNLTGLHLQGNQISDVSPLASLTNLTELHLHSNQISDISPLASLINLTWLNLRNNEISDLSPLASLTNLEWLNLSMNQISDISPLVENSGLGEGDYVLLWINNLDLSEGSKDLENTRQLEKRGVAVHPPAPTPTPAPAPTPAPETVVFADENLEAAIRDALGKTAGEEITAAELAGLKSLVLRSRWGITDLSGIEYCTNLTWLRVGGDQLSDISPLASLTNLTGLTVGWTQLSDISPLASLTNLVELYLPTNEISDISPLASLTNLEWLNLAFNQISDISPLASLTNLEWVSLTSTQISDISPLVENSGLGEGDTVLIEHNNLDLLWEGSEDLENIRQLEGRGVEVQY